MKMRKSILFLTGAALFCGALFYSCSKDEDNNEPVDFTVSDSIVNEENSVIFSDLSQNNPEGWSWSFEGGTPSTSIEQNPTVSYEKSGIYNVTLTVSYSVGEESSVTKSNYVTVVPAIGLVAYYPLDGDSEDYSGNDYHANNNEVEFGTDISGNENQAASFSGSNSYLEIADNDDFNFGTSDFSVSLWIYSKSSASQMIFQKGGLNGNDDPQYWLRLNDSEGDITFLIGDGTVPSVSTSSDTNFVADSSWHHVVAQRNGQLLQIYLDNVLVSETNGELKNISSEQSLKFGLQVLTSASSNNPFIGSMDEIRIYDKALNVDEIDILNIIK